MNFLHTFYFDAAKEAKNCFNMVVNGKKISKIPVVHANENARGIKVILTNFKYDEEINVFAYFKSSSDDEVVRVSPYERNKNTFNLLYPEMEEGEYECEIVVSKGNNVLSSGVFKGRCEKTIRGLFFKDVEVKDTIEGIINSYSTYKTLYENKLKETEGLVDKLNKNMLLNEDLKNQEDIRLRNEVLRIENEASRGLAEENRVSLFEKIVTQSEQISQNEIIRDGNEKTRAENEINRINDETTRKNNELVRIENENRRLDSDTKRAAIVEKIEDLANKTEKAIRDTNEQQKNIDLVKQDVKALSGNIMEKIEEVDSVLTNVKKQVSSINEEENTRNSNETTRIENETSRVDNENVRKKQEDLRVKEEDKRLANELERIDLYKKSLLLSKELTSNNTLNKEQIQEINTLKENLENKETQRETTMNNIRNMVSDFNESESIRVKSENTRTENEANRSDNELARVHTESVRVASETARDNNEQTRISNENERKNNEALRIKAEIEREKNNTIVKGWINNPEQFKGKSAYDLWIEDGNFGSVVDFLQSLIGQKGADGRDGVDGKNADMPNIRDGYWYIGDNNTGIAVDNIDMDRINRMIDSKINDIIGTAPENLNTLEELAKAINNDGDFVNSVKELINSKADKNYIPNNIPAQNIVTDDKHNFVNNEQINKINNALTDSSVINDVSIQNGDGKSTITIQRVGGDAKEIEINSGLSSKEKENIENIKSEISTKADKTSLNNLVKTINSTSTGLSITKNDGSIEEMAIQFPIPDYNNLTNKPNLDIYQPKGDYITNEVFNNTISGVNASISTKADSTDLNELIKSIERVDNSLNITKKDGTKSVVDINSNKIYLEDLYGIDNILDSNGDKRYFINPRYVHTQLGQSRMNPGYDFIIYTFLEDGDNISLWDNLVEDITLKVIDSGKIIVQENIPFRELPNYNDPDEILGVSVSLDLYEKYFDYLNSSKTGNGYCDVQIEIILNDKDPLFFLVGGFMPPDTDKYYKLITKAGINTVNKFYRDMKLYNEMKSKTDKSTVDGLISSISKEDETLVVTKKDGSKASIELPKGFSGDYNDLTNKPDLSNYQTRGDYATNDTLENKVSEVNSLINTKANSSDLNTLVESVNKVNNSLEIIKKDGSKSTIEYPSVFSGDYNDLTNKPISLYGKSRDSIVDILNEYESGLGMSSNGYMIKELISIFGIYDFPFGEIPGSNYTEYDTLFFPLVAAAYAYGEAMENIEEVGNKIPGITKEGNSLLIKNKKNETINTIELPQGFSGDYNDLTNKPNLDIYQPKGDYITNEVFNNTISGYVKKTESVENVINTNSSNSNSIKFWTGTQFEYDKLSSIDENTLYFIV